MGDAAPNPANVATVILASIPLFDIYHYDFRIIIFLNMMCH